MAKRKPLTAEQYPYTGPYGSKASGHKHKGPTVVSLRIAMWRLGRLRQDQTQSDEWSADLARALNGWDPGKQGYGPGRWTKIRAAVVPSGLPHAGELALDARARALVVEEAHGAPPVVELVYPHPAGVPGRVGGIHLTAGFPPGEEFWALDFLAPGGTTVLAFYAGVITRTSGRNPSQGVVNGDRFGWSIYLERDDGTESFTTHYGEKLVRDGQRVEVAQPIGVVGHWPHDEGRSHTHIGVNTGSRARSIALIEAIAHAPRVAL